MVLEYRLKIEFEDLDVNGHATTSQYVNFFERARSAALASQGLTFKEFMAMGFGLVIADLQLRFVKPAFLSEDLFVYTKLAAQSERTLTVEQVITKEKIPEDERASSFEQLPQRVTWARTVLVCVNGKTKKVAAIPDSLKTYLLGITA